MHTLVATFYAHKGGTGRTLALSNVARFLADELGYRVGLVDLDIDSPGLVHEPLCAALERAGPDRDAIRKEIDERKGFIECFLECAAGQNEKLDNIDEFVCSLSGGQNGGIVLMPAARGSVFKDEENYQDAVNKFVVRVAAEVDPAKASGTDGLGIASGITWLILNKFAERYQLDFLFIDGRTGTGLFSPVYLYSVPHLLVLFSGLNEQNVLGSLSVLRATTTNGVAGELPVFFVASPVPTDGPGELERRLAFVTSHLKAERQARRVGANYLYELPTKADHQLPYSDEASFNEAYFPGSYPNSYLAAAYRKLALSIERMVIRRNSKGGSADTRTAIASHSVDSVTVAFENVHADIELVDPKILKVNRSPFAAEDPKAPWERLVALQGGEKEIKALLEEMPDVVVIPQTHLHAIMGKDGVHLLHDLNDLRREFNVRATDFDFLDTYYPNWRRWCSTERSIAGLPFSVNAMLLCSNEMLLDQVCRAYWSDRKQSPPSQFFLPSSWDSLKVLLETGIRNGINRDEIFRVVGQGRGLYFDWLNFVASLGGFDLVQSEGRLTQDVIIDQSDTIEATELFVKLARLSGKSPTMDAQIAAMASGKVAMYMGWTDSFRFNRFKGRLSGVSLTPLGGPQDSALKKPHPLGIRLGHCPRDMHHPRRPLVDGWVMAFPKKASGENLVPALAFASAFLDPENQERILRDGFPSPSAWAIERKLEVLRADQMMTARGDELEGAAEDQLRRSRAEQSFEVFLETVKSAIYFGRWSASPKIKIDEIIANRLLELIGDESMDVGKAMCGLAETLGKKAVDAAQ